MLVLLVEDNPEDTCVIVDFEGGSHGFLTLGDKSTHDNDLIGRRFEMWNL